MKNINELVNQAVEVLVTNGMEKTGGRFAFTGYQDLKINEIEMLEFLFQFDGAMEKFIELVQEYKGSGVHMPIDKLMYHLNKAHNFGFLNRNKVEVLDTISDISQIPMKPRHLVFLDILKDIKPEIEKLFIEAYNQINQHLNPFKVEQTLFYLRESLEYDGIKTKYSDFRLAVPHTFTGDWKPYFCKSNWGYYIKDTLFGGYDGSLSIIQWLGEKPQWSYMSSKGAERWYGYGHQAGAEKQIEKLRELNTIANIEGLDWEIVFANTNDIFFNVLKEGKVKMGDYYHFHQDIPKGKITIHKRLERELLKTPKSKKVA